MHTERWGNRERQDRLPSSQTALSILSTSSSPSCISPPLTSSKSQQPHIEDVQMKQTRSMSQTKPYLHPWICSSTCLYRTEKRCSAICHCPGNCRDCCSPWRAQDAGSPLAGSTRQRWPASPTSASRGEERGAAGAASSSGEVWGDPGPGFAPLAFLDNFWLRRWQLRWDPPNRPAPRSSGESADTTRYPRAGHRRQPRAKNALPNPSKASRGGEAPRTSHAEAVKELLPPRAAIGRSSALRRRLLFFARLPLLGRRSERQRVGEPAAPAGLRQRLRACAGGCVRGVRASSRGLAPSAGRAAAARPGGRGAEAPPACVTAVVTVAGLKTPVSGGEGNQTRFRLAKHLPAVSAGKRCCCSSSGDPGFVKRQRDGDSPGTVCQSRETHLKNQPAVPSKHQLQKALGSTWLFVSMAS